MDNKVNYKTLYSDINKDLFENIISKHEKMPVIVQDFSLEDAIGKGENFSSNMLRAIINYKTNNGGIEKSLKLIVKIETTDVLAAQLAREVAAFEKEIAVYAEILPKIEGLLKTIGDTRKISPTYDFRIKRIIKY